MPKGKATSASGKVGDAIRGAIGRIDRGGNLERARAVGAWRAAAGEEVAAHAVGFAMRDDELLVYVDSAVWASELTALSEHYRIEVNRLVGRELVGSIRFTVSKNVAQEQERQSGTGGAEDGMQQDAVVPVPATPQELAQIEAMAGGIHNEALREAAVRAAIRGLEWRKGASGQPPSPRRRGTREQGESASEH